MDTTLLLPCPFCGGPAEFIHDLYGEGYMSGVCCNACEAGIFSAYGMTSKENLITQWNTRKAEAKDKSHGT